MKLDKDTLIKHRFWLLLGGYTIVWSIGLIFLLMSADSLIATEQGKYDKATKALKTPAAGHPKNARFQEPWKKYEERFKSHKIAVWGTWDVQQSLVEWPRFTDQAARDSWRNAQNFRDWFERFSKEDWSTDARDEYRNKLYLKQFEPLPAIVAPVEFQGGQTGFESIMAPGLASAGSMRRAMGPVPPGAGALDAFSKTIRTVFANTPTVEEIWLAQEDFWVKHELLRCIRQALEEVALCEEVELKQPAPGFAKHRRFRNKSWEVDLLFEQDKDKLRISSKSTVKNIDPSNRFLALANPMTNDRGIEFRIFQDDYERTVEIKGEPVAPGKVREFGTAVPVSTLDPLKPFGMIQLLDWSISPIKRIDEIRLGASSHRTANVTLVPNKALPAEPTAGPGPGTKGPGGKAPGGPTGPGGPAPGGHDGGSDANVTSSNKLPRNRYLYVSEQCRHLPIGLVVVIDQDHIADLLKAIVASKLRILITQVEFEHVRGVRPSVTEALDASKPKKSLESAINLVELSIYGVGSLYQRFDRPAAPAAPNPKDKIPPPPGPKK